MRQVRVALISNQLGGFDGVSVFARTWRNSVMSLGHCTTEIAGRLRGGEHRDCKEIPELWYRSDGRNLRELKERIRESLKNVDMAVLFNVLTLASVPNASAALDEVLSDLQIPVVVLHIDPPYENKHRVQDARFPIFRDNYLNCAITKSAAREIYARFGVQCEVAYVPFESSIAEPTDGTELRVKLGVGRDELLVLHPVGVYKRKRIDRAVLYVNSLVDAGFKVKYYLTGGDPGDLDYNSEAGSFLSSLRAGLITGRTQHQAEAYAAADIVLMTSDWEGWGMPVLEAAAARKPCVAHPYPVLREIESMGVKIYPLDTESVRRIVEQREDVERELMHNASNVAFLSSDNFHFAVDSLFQKAIAKNDARNKD